MKKTFISNLACAWLLFLLPVYTWGQTANQEPKNKETTEYDSAIKDTEDLQPEIPVKYTTLVADWGIANFINTPEHMDLTFGGSRAVHGSLYYNIPIGKSHFMVSSGIGAANTSYTFKHGYTLVRDSQDNNKIKMASATEAVGIKNSKDIKSSMFSVNTVKLALEFRFNSNKEEPQEGFFIAVGGNIGFQYWPSTKIRYEQDNENKVRITEESFNFNKIHYSAIVRTGWDRFGIFYHQTLSTLFNENKGPETDPILPFNIGISINLF